MAIVSRLDQTIKGFGFTKHSFTSLKIPLSIDIYRQWLKDGMNGKMNYLESHLPFKENPHLLAPSAKTAICVLKNYVPHPHPYTNNFPLKNLKMARYATGKDYHRWFKEDLNKLGQQLKTEFPEHDFIAFTDSGPVLERDLAYQAGLGWFGKNTCLIHQSEGSFFFIGEIFTSLDIQVKPTIHPDLCGTCNRCVEACPTQALLPSKKMDATKCISYWTIEAKEVAPVHIRNSLEDWLFGCDICQNVCPWNTKTFGPQLASISPDRNEQIKELQWILTQSNRSLERQIKLTPLDRCGARGLKRNALIVIGNLKINELTEAVHPYLKLDYFKELAQWTLSQLGSSVE